MDLDELKRIANSSTPGPWEVGDHPSKVTAPCPCCGDVATCAQYGPGKEISNYNSEHIAAFNPSVALELIAEVERLRDAVQDVLCCPTAGLDSATVSKLQAVRGEPLERQLSPAEVGCLQGEVERLNTWDGLMSLLDKRYPADVFDGSSGDSGPRITVLIRVVNKLRAVMDAADAFLARPPDGMPDYKHYHQNTTAGDCRALNKAYREAAEAAGGERCGQSEGSDGDTYAGCVLDVGHNGKCLMRVRPDVVRATEAKGDE